MTRREWLRLTASAGGGALLLPNVTGLLGAQGAPATPAGQASAPAVMTPGRERLLADFGWKFHLGHASDPTKDFGYARGSGTFAKSGSLIGGRGGVTGATFNDAEWTSVDLPHDWAVDLPFVNDRNLIGHGCKPLGRAYPETSIGWYRRTFDIPATDLGRRISLEFDGVFRDSMVILNGHYLGRNLSGYSPFRFDVTDLLTYGTAAGPGKNVLLLRVDATVDEGWFYEGAGIYRHVWLEKTAVLHVGHWGTFVTTRPAEPSDFNPPRPSPTEFTVVMVEVDVVNDSDAETQYGMNLEILDTKGTSVARLGAKTTAIAAWSRHTVKERFVLRNAAVWSIETPNLYRLVTAIRSDFTGLSNPGPASVDRYETPFGIRTLRFDNEKGFFLNDKPLKLKGTCNHQDHAGVGAALPDALQEFRITKLKEMGGNAYRTSHNPPTAELLDACDRLGMLVLDETRMMDANDEGLSQIDRLVRRDRNHPSVFAWSIGNEEPEQGTDRGARIAATLKRRVNQLDPTRLVTEAMNNSWGRGLTAVVDIQGFNYGHAQQIDAFRTQFPTKLAMGTEVASTVSTRGIYANDTEKGYVSAYDRNFPSWASTAEEWWTTYDAREWIEGGFVWTGFDYRGEPTPYGWPCINSHFGILDMCGFPKDLFYYYRAWWQDVPVLHLFPHWNWAGKEGQDVEVWCFTNYPRVELFVNGTSAGAQDVKKNSHVAWKVPYAPGAIEVRAAAVPRSGAAPAKPAMTTKRETSGAAAKIQLKVDRARLAANAEDLAVVAADIVDAQGRIVPTAGNEVTFTVSSGGKIIGVGNGDPSSHESDRGPKRSAFNGMCMALVQATAAAGDIRVDASSPGLAAATTTIVAETATLRARLV